VLVLMRRAEISHRLEACATDFEDTPRAVARGV